MTCPTIPPIFYGLGKAALIILKIPIRYFSLIVVARHGTTQKFSANYFEAKTIAY